MQLKIFFNLQIILVKCTLLIKSHLDFFPRQSQVELREQIDKLAQGMYSYYLCLLRFSNLRHQP